MIDFEIVQAEEAALVEKVRERQAALALGYEALMRLAQQNLLDPSTT